MKGVSTRQKGIGDGTSGGGLVGTTAKQLCSKNIM